MTKRNHRKFTAEQKADAVRLARKVGSIGQVARDLDLTESALRNWAKQADIDGGHGPARALTTEEMAELPLLRRPAEPVACMRGSSGISTLGRLAESDCCDGTLEKWIGTARLKCPHK